MRANATLLLPLPGFEPLAACVAGVEVMRPTFERFESGEVQVGLPGPVGERDCTLLGTVAGRLRSREASARTFGKASTARH